jgi:putative membrane protein insertion efficiency factor
MPSSEIPAPTVASLPARALLGAIRLYQATLSPALPALLGPGCGCRFHPTCSHYAAGAVRHHGALRGSWLALRRLAKCQPLHPGGVDLVPPVGPVPAAAHPAPGCHRVSA